jgi:hypothetical protein
VEFPKHISFNLNYNEHIGSGIESVEEYCDLIPSLQDCDWVSHEEKELAFKNNEFYTFRWHPSTPNGHCILAAYSLKVLLEVLALMSMNEKLNATKGELEDGQF